MFVIVIPVGFFSYSAPAYASTNANLFVSAENSQWNNYFAGPQVIQVVVADPDINRLDQAYGEPVVTINGKRLRMAQGTDGNWYAYFADRNQAIAADKTSGAAGKGLDFGQFCSSSSSTPVTFHDTKGFTVARAVAGSVDKPTSSSSFGACTDLTTAGGTALEHVVRQNKTLTQANGAVTTGQVGYTDSNVWPIIQLYDFSSIPTAVTVDYQKSGGDQIVNLTFDRIPKNLISMLPDRFTYSQNSQVFLTLNDPQLNIDPTEEDSWTWGANAINSTLYYQAFDRSGNPDADNIPGAMQNLIGNLTTFMFDHNGKLIINSTAQGIRVIDFQSNGKQVLSGSLLTRNNPALVRTNSISSGSEPITLVESGGVDTGVFVNWDDSKKSNIVTVDSPVIRGQSAVVRYNDISTSIVGGFAFATLTQTAQNNTWASGQRIPVTLADNDENKNSKISERMFLYDPTYKREPAMVIGTPFTLSTGTSGTGAEVAAIEKVKMTFLGISGLRNLVFDGGPNATASNFQEDEAFSARPIFNFTNTISGSTKATINSTSALFVDLKTTMNTLLQTIHNTNRTNNAAGFKGFNFFNYDLRSFSSLNGATGGSISNIGVYLVYNNAGTGLSAGGLALKTGLNAVSLANSTNLQNFINLNGTNSGLNTGVGTSEVANPALINQNLFSNIAKTAPIGLLFTFTTANGNVVLSTNGQPIVADFFSVGLISDGTQSSQRINNGIFRYELEETGDNTGIFTGTNQYVMLNQLNIFDPNTYSTLRPIHHDVYFPAIQDMLQSEARAPQVKYLDLGQDGVNTQISAQQDITTHTGVVSFDSKTYNMGDTVTITLNDQDLNVNNDLIDIYTAVTPKYAESNIPDNTAQDLTTDTVGKTGLRALSDGTPFGMLSDVEFGAQHVRWSNSNIPGQPYNSGPCFATESNAGTDGGLATSLSATGFSLVETGPSTGIFTGTFVIPDELCRGNTVISPEGQDMKVNYVDFRDESSKIVMVSYDATIATKPQNEQYRILFKSGHFIPASETSIASEIALIKDSLKPDDVVHFLIQFQSIPDQSKTDELASQGIRIVDYMTGNTYLAWSKSGNLDALQSISGIRWLGPFSPEYKISSLLNPIISQNIPDWTLHNNRVMLTMQLHREANLTDTIIQLVQKLGGHIDGVVTIVPYISADFDLNTISDTISNIAKIDEVQFISFVDPPLKAENDQARATSSVTLAKTLFPELNGTGVKVLVYDDGFVDKFNEDFVNRVTDIGTQTSISDHSTGVAGTLGGTGTGTQPGNPLGQFAGMAPNVQIFSSAFLDPDGMIPPTETGQGLQNDVEYAMDHYQVDLVSMSLGAKLCDQHQSAYLSEYANTSVLIDDLVIGGHNSTPIIFFEAAGNNRGFPSSYNCPDFKSIDIPAAAKNSIVVGAINTEHGMPMTSYSSWGPTSDGRIKPDIVAPGSHDNVTGLTTDVLPVGVSTGSMYSAIYGSMSPGTSFATPVASGTAALLIQEWHNFTSSSDPSPSTIKAIMIHTATDLGLPGPDYQYGWGALNATAAINLVHNNGTNDILIHQGLIGTVHQNDSYHIIDNTGNFDIKATLVWDDKLPASLAMDPALKNDLGLTMVDQNGRSYFPFLLDPNNPTRQASREDITHVDQVNNVKMDIGSATAGTWTIWVNSTKVSLAPQQYSIIITKIPRSTSVDQIPPVVTVPSNQAVDTSDPTGTTVTYPQPTATDNVGVTSGPSCDKLSGSKFPVGITTVTCSASDAAGNIGQASFAVTVSLIGGSQYAQVTIIKTVNKGLFGEDLPPSSFPLSISNTTKTISVTSGVQVTLSPGHYQVSEVSTGGFTGTFGGPDCDNNGNMVISAGQSATCNISNNHCLIATAAFGSELAPEVQFLRDFRDNHLQKTNVGSDFMKVFNQWYYSFSPSVANYEVQSTLLREVIKGSIYPLLGILFVSEKAFFLIGGNYGTMAAGLIAVSMMGAVYVSPLTLSIKSIRSGKTNLKFAAFVVLGILVVTIGAILSGNQTVIILTSLLFLLSLMTFAALMTAKMFVVASRKFAKIRDNSIFKRNQW